MGEVPAVALAAERFAAELDFFSIGTNDLAQYTMAAERGNAHVAGLLAGVPPALLRLVAATTAAAKARGRWVGVCGELAARPSAALLFAGLGVRELSMAPRAVAEVKQALRDVPLARAAEVVARALDAEDADEVEALAAPLLEAG
jgi:phosphocarrier protein FPr